MKRKKVRKFLAVNQKNEFLLKFASFLFLHYFYLGQLTREREKEREGKRWKEG